MKISPLSFNLNSQTRNSKIQNQPSFKAVWSEQTLETAKTVGEETGIDVLAKLNSFLDSNPKLKEFGGDKVELSIGAKEYKRSNHIACFASVSMPDGSDKRDAKYTLEYPGCTTNGFAMFPSEREILMRIANGDCVTENEVKDIINKFQTFDDMLEKFSQQIESDKKRLIENECAAELRRRLETEVPAMREKLSKYLSEA